MKLHQTIRLTTLGLLFLTGTAISAPRLVMPETDFNFGFVPQNSQISHQFWLYSKGEDSLRILRVVPG